MKKLKSSLINMTLVLSCFAVITAGLLAWVNSITSAPIQKQAEENLKKGIKTVMGNDKVEVERTDTIKKDNHGKQTIYVIHNVSLQGKPLGAAVESAAQGFGGTLKVLVGFDKQGTIQGYTILETAETPGLGSKADKWFQKDGKGNIIGKQPNGKFKVKNDGGSIDAITASTITSRAFLSSISQAYTAYIGKDVDSHSGASKKAHKKKGGKKHEKH